MNHAHKDRSAASTPGGDLVAIAVSRRGAKLATRIARDRHGAQASIPARFLSSAARDGQAESLIIPYQGRVAAVIEAAFRERRPLALVMATGAAVRLLAPLLQDKQTDPAVVVVDDSGRFVISLLSGHAGGANKLARELANLLCAAAVVTTASETAGVPAIDELAAQSHWKIESNVALTAVAAALVNGETVGVYQDAGQSDWLASGDQLLRRYETIAELAAAQPAAAVLISDRLHDISDLPLNRTVVCRPPALVLGIGCSTDVTSEEIETLIDHTLARAGLSALSVSMVATIDRRREHPALESLLRQRSWSLITFSAEELDRVEGDWSRSSFVHKMVGTSGVAEPAALAAAGSRTLVVRKTKSARATLAIARRQQDA